MRPVYIHGTKDTIIEGITIANSAFHSIILTVNDEKTGQAEYNTIKWVKIFTWRANGDGINPSVGTVVEDCFIRTQDDSTYVNSPAIRRVVYWQDSNGSTFVMTPLGNKILNSRASVVEDITVIYSRSHWHHWSGGCLFNMRCAGAGEGGYTLTFRNIVVEDPRPTLQHFKILMQAVEPWIHDSGRKRRPGDLRGIVFQNISITAPSILNEPEVLWGMEDGLIFDLLFDNVTIGEVNVEDVDFFHHNEFVFH